jgi:hypothetical protein
LFPAFPVKSKPAEIIFLQPRCIQRGNAASKTIPGPQRLGVFESSKLSSIRPVYAAVSSSECGFADTGEVFIPRIRGVSNEADDTTTSVPLV